MEEHTLARHRAKQPKLASNTAYMLRNTNTHLDICILDLDSKTHS